MTFRSDAPAEIAFFVVITCWLGLSAILVIGNKGAAKSERKRDLKSRLGFLLHGGGYAICFVFPRTFFSPFIPMPKTMEIAVSALTIGVALASVWFCFLAARTLGRQWSLVARVIDDHELVMHGPYAVVRNPIYLAMFGMLVATGLALSRWQALIVAAVVFSAGSAIRIRSEERLLREAFGPRFDEYASRIPGLFPRIR